MMGKKLVDVIHKKVPVFAFLPWVAFWNQGGASRISDYMHVRVAVAPRSTACREVTASFVATIARSNAAREKGLSNRSAPLKPDEAMLFIFDVPQEARFWMKDTLFPLEIAYFDPQGQLARLFEMPKEKDPANPLRQYDSETTIVAALEVSPLSLNQSRPGESILCIDTAIRP